MEEKDTLLTVDEFATKIKEKYPEYKDVDNLTLANKIVEKYPEYKSKVSFEGTPEVKKKDSTQPVQTQEAPTQEGPLLGLGGVSERPTPSPSVGIGEGVFPGKSPIQDLKESIQDPLLKAQERAKRQQVEPASSQNLLRTEKFVPYTDEVVEDADYKKWKSSLPGIFNKRQMTTTCMGRISQECSQLKLLLANTICHQEIQRQAEY
jgi:hypothetical protein